MNFDSDEIINILKSEIDEIYLVGGAVRDYLLGKSTFDKDILVNNAKEFAQKISAKYRGTYIPLDEINNIYRVVFSDKINYVDITQPLNNSLIDDLSRRDFTINSIAVNLKNNEIIDINGGINDLNNKIIKSISEKNIIDDPLRILRAFRFIATLGFDIDKNTLIQIDKHLDLINKPAKERINYEILKLFDGKYSDKALILADKLIEKIYPAFSDVKKVPPNTHHHLCLYNHSVETVKRIQILYENADDKVKSHLEKKDFGGFSRLTYLKFAGFFHDIGKFSTWTIEGDRHRFIKHDDVGSKMAKDILKLNKFSKKQIEYISSMIKNHIYPSQVVSSEIINEKIYMRYIRKMNENVIDNIILAKADRLSARGSAITEKMLNDNIENLDKLLNYYLKIKQTLKPLPKLLSGNEIMNLTGLTPSKKLGEIIELLHQAQLDGKILSKSDAIDFVKKKKIIYNLIYYLL